MQGSCSASRRRPHFFLFFLLLQTWIGHTPLPGWGFLLDATILIVDELMVGGRHVTCANEDCFYFFYFVGLSRRTVKSMTEQLPHASFMYARDTTIDDHMV